MANVLRKLSTTDKVPALVNIYYYSVCGTVISLTVTFVSNIFTYPCQSEFLYIVAFVTTGLLAQLLMNVAFQYERANTVMVLMTMVIIFTLVLEVSYHGKIKYKACHTHI